MGRAGGGRDTVGSGAGGGGGGGGRERTTTCRSPLHTP